MHDASDRVRIDVHMVAKRGELRLGDGVEGGHLGRRVVVLPAGVRAAPPPAVVGVVLVRVREVE